jgi:hypothetical protein
MLIELVIVELMEISSFLTGKIGKFDIPTPILELGALSLTGDLVCVGVIF